MSEYSVSSTSALVSSRTSAVVLLNESVIETETQADSFAVQYLSMEDNSEKERRDKKMKETVTEDEESVETSTSDTPSNSPKDLKQKGESSDDGCDASSSTREGAEERGMEEETKSKESSMRLEKETESPGPEEDGDREEDEKSENGGKWLKDDVHQTSYSRESYHDDASSEVLDENVEEVTEL